MANAALYLSAKKLDIAKWIPGTTHNGGFFKAPTTFRVPRAGGAVQFNVMPAGQLKQHLSGFIGYVRSLPGHAASKVAAEQQIMRVSHVLGLVTERELDDKLGSLLFAIAHTHDGFLFVSNSILLPNGEALVGPLAEQNPREERQVPVEAVHGVARTSRSSPNPTAAQLERRTRNIAAVREMGLPVLESLPCVEDEATIKPRSGAEIAQRGIANTVCAVKGETGDNDLVLKIVKSFGAEAYFTPAEQKFVDDQKPSQQDRINFSFRYECSHVFWWSLGLIPSLKPPGELCDVPGECSMLRDMGTEKLITSAKPRAMHEILDAADLYYRLSWAAVDLMLKKQKSDRIDRGVVAERHRAFNWLIRYMNQEWDDVTLDT